MRLIVSDMPGILPPSGEDILLTPEKAIQPCTGCYHCWTRTPGVCALRDGYEGLPSLLAQADECVFVSRLVLGGFSPYVKNVLDRSLGYLLPFFSLYEGSSHHPLRWDKRPVWKVFFYGGSPAQRKTARRLLRANARNLEIGRWSVFFAEDLQQLREVLREHLSD